MTDVEVKEGGRSRARNRARWFGHVRACAGSGLSVAAYCRREGLRYNSFRRWRFAFRESGEELGPGESLADSVGGAETKSPESLFAEVAVRATSLVVEASAIEVVLPGERRIRVAPGFDENTLRRLVAALEDVRC